jgi:hypothetical protein
LDHYQRSLQVSESLLAANPNSAQAARDVMVSLERMAKSEAGLAGGATKALELQTRALGLALGLRERNPESLFYGRATAVSLFLTAQRAHAAGQEEVAMKCLGECFQLMDEMISAGWHLDAGMVELHGQLKRMYET